MWNNRLIKLIVNSIRDLLPILIVVLVFQLLVVRQPIPDIASLIVGMVCVVMGLTFFMLGLEQSLFPIGETMANAFARKGSLFWLLAFSFCLGFGTTVAEPALIAIGNEAAKIASQGGMIADSDSARADYAWELRLTVAISVGVAVIIGVIRILKGWPLHYFIVGGYLIVICLTPFAPREILGIAYDSGGVTTSSITVPLLTALGIGLANSIKGRNPVTDGFGLIAFASLTPIIFVMSFGILLR
ncbi:MAG: DUF1538 domain-containing protein [Methylomonas sp.]|nr:DUF1538 domain-containing protein [Methylomonas sp.]PPD19503.1 MAG: hypothetical protein CTY23_11610 [Methylomonas sp.]PPD24793.1 MAG: hypothetical protein CTY22_10585 [Methylomonas sp.]PPD33492.1 MAG: hypothetical protein CTY21_10565 [Methylomonas sp.]PPD53805.1 MAG: hypothetical protein CTY11_05240 [Methylomonas sp.]